VRSGYGGEELHHQSQEQQQTHWLELRHQHPPGVFEQQPGKRHAGQAQQRQPQDERAQFGGDPAAYAEPRGGERGGEQQMVNDQAGGPGGDPDIGRAQPLQMLERRADASPERLLGDRAVLMGGGKRQKHGRQRERYPGAPFTPANVSTAKTARNAHVVGG
jgi:hypothetical protein